ncbi:7TM diverse intracellular signaling domain-containing protein [Thalassolituus sp. LLYu03]|uniref:7TM diverse intracellular signaling domain-containing protein n=1 Tax=Thalassolituus sp. LLYu03 TaxID=3421656 RepID=UPI003D2A52E3
MASANALRVLSLLALLCLSFFTSAEQTVPATATGTTTQLPTPELQTQELQAHDAQPLPPVLSLSAPGDYSIGLFSQWLEDRTLTLTADDVMAHDDWTSSDSPSLNFGYSRSAYWLKTRIHAGKLHDWALWIRYSLLDYVEFYLCPEPFSQADQCQTRLAGDEVPYNLGRDVNHPNLIIRFPMAEGQNYVLLMRVQTKGTHQIPASLVDSKTLQQELDTNSIVRGGYYATMVVMGLYNLFIFFLTRERSYLYYTAVTLTFLMFHMTYEGSAFQFFWPDHPSINHFALPLMFLVNSIFVSLFVPNFLQLKENSHGAYRLFRVFTALSCMLLVMLPLLKYQVILPITNMLSSVMLIAALIIGIRFWLQGQAAARFFTIAWAALIAGLILANARSLGLIPTNNFTLYAYQIGSFMEVILLSMALGERIMRMQKEQLETRKAMLKSQEEAIQYLRDYEDLYQNSLTGKFQLDEDGFFMKSNPAWRAMLGYGEQSRFISDNPTFNSLFALASERRALWRRLKDNGRVQGYVAQLVQPVTGERIMVSLTVRRTSHGDRISWVGSGQNVTEEYQREQALIHLQKEKTQALRQLVMGIAHEMNTPLGNIRLAESFLNDESREWSEEELHKNLQEGLSHVHEGIERLNSLNQLMKNAVVQENQYAEEEVAIRQWLTNWACDMRTQHPQVNLTTEIHSYITEWQTYPDALQIVLTQLFDNSCTHNADLLGKQQLAIAVQFRERGEYFELHYNDNGKGINAEQRDVIFMPFYTTQRTSARSKGLGLYQTYNLLTDLLHGQIEWPDGEEGFALIVRFPLPADDKSDTNCA